MIELWRLRKLVQHSTASHSRTQFLANLFDQAGVSQICEIGVLRGNLTESLLTACPSITRYYLIDPWRHLPDWDKPSNVSDAMFEDLYQETLQRVAPFKDKVTVLRDVTKEAIPHIPDGSLDAIYVDGDHTLRGITLDLTLSLPKLRQRGLLCGDDFTRNIWQHGADHAPSQVFPYALYFAEAHDLPIITLPNGQFIIYNQPRKGFRVFDYGGFMDLSLRDIYTPPEN